MKLLVRDAILDGEPSTLGIEDGRIAFVDRGGRAGGSPADHGASGPGTGTGPGGRSSGGDGEADGTTAGPAGPEGSPARPFRADRVVDAAGLHAFPSLRNAHTHAAMTLFRGWGDDLPLMEWLREHVWPAEEAMTAEDVYHGTRLAALEMIRSGTTWFNEMYWHADRAARAVEEMGLRVRLGAIFIDHGDAETAERWRREVRRRVEEREALGPRVELALAPHAVYTVSRANLEWLGELAREHDLPVHIHLSETRGEVEDCVEEHGVRPARLLEEVGLVGPRLVAAHGVHLDADERALLGEAGATVVTNPTANLKLAVGGIFDHDAARRAGIRVALGTDGAGSNNNLDMLEEMKVAALVQKHRAGDPRSLPAAEALALATTAPAEALGPGSGRLEPGEPGDLMLVDLSGPATTPGHDPVSDLVYAASGCSVHTTVCDGRVLMHDREVEVADEEEILREAREAARALVERAEGG